MTAMRRDADFVRGKTALLFVDMQKVFALPGGDRAHPERGPEHEFYRNLATTVIPNQRRIRDAPNSAFSSAFASDGALKVPVGAGPPRKLTSTLATVPSPISR